MEGIVLEARGVSRAYGEGIAVDDATVRFDPGRIHAIVGENGAGKSTLLKMLAGAVAPTAGAICVAGSPLVPATQAEAIRRGVGLVYQHFALVPAFTGLENLMLGVEPVSTGGVLRHDEMRRRAEDVAKANGLAVRLDVPVRAMGVGERQRLEIVRVLVRGARALLLDEPTAVLTPAEAESLYALLRSIAQGGATVAIVTHHLVEVAKHADEVTVMRRGRIVFHGPAREKTIEELAKIALGSVPPVPASPRVGEEAETVLDVGVGAKRLAVKRGEIVGVAGVDGNGQDALVLGIAGLDGDACDVRICGKSASHLAVADRRALGLETIHGDRHRFGLLASATIHDNLILGDPGADEDATVRRRLAASGVVPSHPTLLAGALSGGNQQKLVVARALDREPRVLVATYPTRGIDAAAAAAVRVRIAQAAKDGAGVLLVSGDLVELRELSHRIVVLHRGEIVAELPPSASEEELGRAMLGAA